MIESKTLGSRLFDIVNVILLLMLTFFFLYPMWYVLVASFSEPFRIFTNNGILFWPAGYSLKGYIQVFRNANILTGYKNTLFIVTVGTACNMLMTTLGAYVLSRRNIMLNKLFTIMVVVTMYFGGGLIPTYLIIKGIGLLDSLWAVILPGVISTWNMIVMRTAFRAVPQSLEESARIDGANDFTILFRIIVPVTKATMAVMVLFYAVGHWNSWFSAMVYISDKKKYPLQLFLREILIVNMANAAAAESIEDSDSAYLAEVIRYATIIISTVPILALYPFLQKYFVKGVMMGSIKE